MPSISPTVQSVLYAGITKSVGSIFRVKDDWKAPPDVLRKTVERESILLGLTTLFTTGIQILFTEVLSGFMKRNPRFGRYELIWRALATAPALLFAEAFSRELAPKTPWGNLTKPVTLMPSRTPQSASRLSGALVAATPLALHRSPFYTAFEKTAHPQQQPTTASQPDRSPAPEEED